MTLACGSQVVIQYFTLQLNYLLLTCVQKIQHEGEATIVVSFASCCICLRQQKSYIFHTRKLFYFFYVVTMSISADLHGHLN